MHTSSVIGSAEPCLLSSLRTVRHWCEATMTREFSTWENASSAMPISMWYRVNWIPTTNCTVVYSRWDQRSTGIVHSSNDYCLRTDENFVSDRIQSVTWASCRIVSFAELVDRVDHCSMNRSSPICSFVRHRFQALECSRRLPMSPARCRCHVSKWTMEVHCEILACRQ
jgi:hypothetical protein